MLVKFLEANRDKQVGEIQAELLALISKSRASKRTTSVRDSAGNVFAIFCYYHKTWELVSEVEYGKKASSSTGLNTMCKIGQRSWTKQQALIKKVDPQLLAELQAGTLQVQNLSAEKESRVEAIKRQCFDAFALEQELQHTKEEVEALLA